MNTAEQIWIAEVDKATLAALIAQGGAGAAQARADMEAIEQSLESLQGAI
jgi:hypothetical protein